MNKVVTLNFGLMEGEEEEEASLANKGLALEIIRRRDLPPTAECTINEKKKRILVST